MRNLSEFGETPARDNAERRTVASETEIAWLAGIVDGEGTICPSQSKENPSYPPYWRIMIANSDLILLEKAQDVIFKCLGVTGKLMVKKQYGRALVKYTRPAYSISIGRLAHVEFMVKLLLPYLTSKRERAKEFLAYCSIHPHRPRVETERKALGLMNQDEATVRANG